MRRRWPATVGLGLLALAAAAVLVVALRPSTPPGSAGAPSPTLTGVVAAHGRHVWRWVGPGTCGASADTVPIETSSGGVWTASDVPLVTVTRLSFADGRRGIAVGTDGRCVPGAALTGDGGRTWTLVPDAALLDAWYVGRRVWGITRIDGPAQLVSYDVVGGELRVVRVAAPVCDAGDGSPSRSVWQRGELGLLLCEHAVISDRLLAATRDAGARWVRLTDGRAISGLDGRGPVRDLDTVSVPTVAGHDSTRASSAGAGDTATAEPSPVWVLFPPGECPEGQLRRSTTSGLTFDRLPCPSETADVDDALSVTFTSARRGVLLALLDDQPVVYVTSDAGATWSWARYP